MDLHEFAPRGALVGMVHLRALPGSARDRGDLRRTIESAVADARTLADAGFDALMVENFFDAPFPKASSPAVTIAAMALAVEAVRSAVSIPVGVNVLRNDVVSAISIAHVCGAAFVRCNVYVGAAVTDQGIIEGAAREAIETRRWLGAHVRILADVAVKHASPLAAMPIEQEARDAVERGLADGLIVSGIATGSATSADDLARVRAACPGTPLFVGSGATAETVAGLLAAADGAIVGSWLKRDGRVEEPVDPDRARAMAAARDGARR